MILKRDLLNTLDDLTLQVLRQEEDIASLERRIRALELSKCTCPKGKRGPGRPKKCCKENDLEKAIKAVTKKTPQPRDKSGKFAKKK